MTYEWPLAAHWVDDLRSSLARLVPLTDAEIEQPYEGAVLIEVTLDGVTHEVAIDYFDKTRVLDDVLDRCSLVFKMQYRAEGYGSRHVVAGGYVPGQPSLYQYLPAIRKIHDNSRPRFDVYGRFGQGHAEETRRRALGQLSAQRRFTFQGSLTPRPYLAYLRETALSRVCVDLPGNGDMCHRLVDYLAVGCCVVRPLPTTTLHVPLTEGVHIKFCKADLSDLVDTCAELVADSERSRHIGRASREYFDSYLHQRQLAGYYIDCCLSLDASVA